MTAKQVGDKAVIADEPTEAPMTGRDGKPLVWYQTRTLLLDDGTTTYGCAHCDYTNDNIRSIRPHLNAHATRKPSPRTGRDPANLSLNELMGRLDDLAKVEADRDKWKQRAVVAERSLATLRKALREVSG